MKANYKVVKRGKKFGCELITEINGVEYRAGKEFDTETDANTAGRFLLLVVRTIKEYAK